MSRQIAREEAIFSDALAQPEAQRAAFVDRACSDDPTLRVQILALLAAHERSDSLRVLATSNFAAIPDEGAGDRIGRYKLLQKIGEGGCGVVWMAEQEEPVRRRVALKVIRLGMDTRDVVARFSAERQALAMMDHPAIAKVFDAGSTGTGRPYFVMELVRGVRITKFCDDQHLDVSARLELFIQVCHAVQHAHQKGIIHRDLKPSNILVGFDDSGALPKVIDFGIAKATQGPLTDATIVTLEEQLIGTPAYMSPEQAEMNNLDIDTRTDVYSLGVVLYELLAGGPPFDPKSLANSSRDEVRRIIREVDPPKPSTRLSTLGAEERAKLARLRGIAAERFVSTLSGDLDWIVMKALEKNRARRYATPTALAEDIARHLENEPVVARPPGRFYTCRKFIRRNRLMVTTVAAITLTLVVGAVVSVALAVRATKAERAANSARARVLDERARADDLLAFLFDDLKEPLAKIGDLRVLDRVIARATAYFEAHGAYDLDDRRFVKHAIALNRLGGLRMDTARYPEAERAYRDAYTRAVALVGRYPRDPEMLLARLEAEWGIGTVYYRQGHIREALGWFQRQGATRAELVALEPENPTWRIELAMAQHDLAVLMMDDDVELSRRTFREELATLETLLPTAPQPIEVQRKIATANLFLGLCAEAAGDYAEAEQRYAQQIKVLEEIARAKPDDRHWQYKIGEALTYQAGLVAIMGRRNEAHRDLARARELLTFARENDPTNERIHKSLVRAILIQALLATAAGEFVHAAEVAVHAINELESLARKEPSDLQTQYRLALALRCLAGIQYAIGAADAAATAARAVQVSDQLSARPGASPIHRTEKVASRVLAGRIARARGDESAAHAYWSPAQAAVQANAPNTHDWRIVDPAARLASLLGEKDRASALKAQLAAFGYVPLEPWP